MTRADQYKAPGTKLSPTNLGRHVEGLVSEAHCFLRGRSKIEDGDGGEVYEVRGQVNDTRHCQELGQKS
jgi:hypothetical protein